MKTSIYLLSCALLLSVTITFTSATHAASSGAEEVSTASNEAVASLSAIATRQIENGDLNAANATLERALRIAPKDASLWHLLGEVRTRQGEPAEAEALIARAKSLEPHRAGPENERSAITEEDTSTAGGTHPSPLPHHEHDTEWVDSRGAMAGRLEEQAHTDTPATTWSHPDRERQQIVSSSERRRQAQREREQALFEQRLALQAEHARRNAVHAPPTNPRDSARHPAQWHHAHHSRSHQHRTYWQAETEHAWKRAEREGHNERKAEERARRAVRKTAKHTWRHQGGHKRDRNQSHVHEHQPWM